MMLHHALSFIKNKLIHAQKVHKEKMHRGTTEERCYWQGQRDALEMVERQLKTQFEKIDEED